MENTNIKPTGGGVIISPNIKKTRVIIDKNGNVIEVADERNKKQVIKSILRK